MPVSSRRTTQWSAQTRDTSSSHGGYSAAPRFDYDNGPAPPYTTGAPDAQRSRYGPNGPAYVPAPYAAIPAATYYDTTEPIHDAPALPFFEAALARSRGPIPLASAPNHSMPSYLPPPDPNHPDIAVGFNRNVTIRGSQGYHPHLQSTSRSPSPVAQLRSGWTRPQTNDVESALLTDEDREYGFRSPYLPLDEKEIDLALPPFQGDTSPPRLLSALPSLYRKVDHADPELDSKDGDLADGVMQHFGPAPTGRIGRRTHNADGHRRIKHSATLDDNGFFAVDMPIPTRLAQFLPFKGVEEQKTTRYTAVTIDPDDFPTSGLRLRQNVCNPPRQTEMFIVITMYNEDAELFCRTLYGVMKNIAHLCGRKNSRVWGKDGWQKVVVCIVADGRKVVNPRVLDCLAALGVYQEGAMTNMVKDRPVTAHVFEYTTSFALDGDLHFKYPDKGIVPCQIIFCMKEKNAKKINSHRWFFNAFAPLLSPNVCILLDVGTRPETKSLYHLWKAFDLNSKVGGACGEIATFKGKTWRGLLNPLVAAQCFEYKMSNILDKPMESLFGYCTVLPGAFSAYRWIALQNNADGKGPLASYFQGEELNTGKADSFTGNMAKSKANWILKFVKSAVGETDCPDTIPEFIAQRRRWLNGSFFAAVYSLIHVGQIWRSDHSFLRKVALMVESVYNAINLIFTWFAMANFYIFFVILTSSIESPVFAIPNIKVLNTFAQYGYLGALVACFIFGMGNRPQGAPWKYKGTIYFFALLTTYMLVCAVLCAIQAIRNFDSPIFVQMVISLISTYGVFIASSLLALDPWHLVTCFAQYILFSPTYINVLNVYAYSNLHDLSWGTKGSDAVQAVDLGAIQGVGKHVEVELVSSQQDIDIVYQDALDNIRLKRAKVDEDEKPSHVVSEQQQKDIYANFRTNLLLLWSLSNAALASAILSGRDASSTFESGAQTRTAVYMLIVLIFVAGMAMFRFICSTLYLIDYLKIAEALHADMLTNVSCGDAVLFLIKATRTISYSTIAVSRALHRLANENINSVPYQTVDVKWLKLYTESAILGVLAEILSTEMSIDILDAIRRLDLAIIIAGGSDQLPMIYTLISLLQQQLPEPCEKLLLPPRRKPDSSLQYAPNPIQDIPEPSVESFITQSSSPFVVRGYASGRFSSPRWRALDRWASAAYLSKTAGPGRVVPVEIGRAYDEEGWTQKIIPFDDFLQRAGFLDDTSEAVYLAQYSLFRQIPELEKDIAMPDYVWMQPESTYPGYVPSEPQLNVWVGSGSSKIVSPPHTDPFFNCYIQVVGHKRVWLAPPHVTSGMGAYSVESGEGSAVAKEYMGNTSRVPILKCSPEEVWTSHPDFKRDVYPHSFEAVLEPGDLLFMPPGWWHSMRGEGGPGWSVSIWF